MDFTAHLKQAWKLTTGNIIPLVIMTLATVIASVISYGILAPFVLSGYMQSVLMMIRSGREPRIQDLYDDMHLLLPLLGFGLVVSILMTIGFSMLFLPGLLFIVFILFFCHFMLPLMTDRNFGLSDAIKKGFEMITGEDSMENLVAAMLFIGIASVGTMIVLGWLFTLPLGTTFLLLLYEKKSEAITGDMSAESQPPVSEPEKNVEEEIVIKMK